VLAEYKNNLANMLKENFGVDVRGKIHTYKKSILFTFGKDNKSTFGHIIQYLLQLREVGSINELKVRLFFLSLTGTIFSWVTSLAPNSISSRE
jgi:hypothetical protein